jgi:hypothetical protein
MIQDALQDLAATLHQSVDALVLKIVTECIEVNHDGWNPTTVTGVAGVRASSSSG